MYIFGGLNGKTKTHFNDLHRYSIKGNYWEQVNVGGIRPCPRRRQACVQYKDKVFLFGGTRYSKTINICELIMPGYIIYWLVVVHINTKNACLV